MFYKLKLFDLERELPILKAPSGVYISGFNCVGDMELLTKAGQYLANKLISNNIEYDVILTTEVKGIAIAQEVARNLNCDYVCLRKESKCYMLNPKCTSGESITSGKSNYYICQLDLNKLKNKRVVFVDDVFSTGKTFDSMINFANNENFKIVAGLAILKEENGKNKDIEFRYKNIDIYCCGYLPLPKEIN